MGGAASLGGDSFGTVLPEPVEGQERFYCHECNCSFYLTDSERPDGMLRPECTACGSGFVEHVLHQPIDLGTGPAVSGGALEDLLPVSTCATPCNNMYPQ